MHHMKRGRLPLPALRARKRPRVTQSQVARAAGMGRYRYWQIENADGADPTEDEKNAVAAVFGVKVADIEWPEQVQVLAS
jgi:transcriptional regulator with XRE-family HTH domain